MKDMGQESKGMMGWMRVTNEVLLYTSESAGVCTSVD